jgi:hypothetical protein
MQQHRALAGSAKQPSSPRPSSFSGSSCPARSLTRHLRYAFVVACVSVVAAVAGTSADAQPTPVRHFARFPAASSLATFVAEASRRFGIPAAWIRAVMRAESFGDVRAISPKGAMGLMQIMPETWLGLRQRYHLGADPYDAHDNIIAGTAYLRELHDRYGIPGFLAAYNAGPARWENHLATGRPLPAETRAYLIRLAPIVGSSAADDTALLASIVKSWTDASLFPKHAANASDSTTTTSGTQQSARSNTNSAQDWTGLAPQSDGLFVALSSTGRPQ